MTGKKNGGKDKVMKYIVLGIIAVMSFYLLVHVSPALALLSMMTLLTMPMVPLSLEIAKTDDNRTRRGNARNNSYRTVQSQMPSQRMRNTVSRY